MVRRDTRDRSLKGKRADTKTSTAAPYLAPLARDCFPVLTVDAIDLALLLGGGFAAGAFNALAGGGSLLTVPLLIALGLPPTVANGTNRLGVLASNITSAWSFRAEGVGGLREGLRVFVPVGIGGLVGAYAISQLDNETFEKVFAIIMLALLYPTLRPRRPRTDASVAKPWSRPATFLVFLAIGIYGGAIQAGVGLVLIFALVHAGYDLVRSNSIKVVVVGVLTAFALPVFIYKHQVDWLYGGLLAVGFAVGGIFGARWTVAGGERLVRPALALAVIALAGRMLSLY